MSISDEMRDDGRVWLRGLFSRDQIQNLAALTGADGKPGKRLELSPHINRLIGPTSRLGDVVETIGVDAAPVRLVAFNKSADANWSVPWHQDRVLAVREKSDVKGYKNWTNKQSFWHCEGPKTLLSQMIFVRVHLDAQTELNGAMELALRSHQRGYVLADHAQSVANACEIETCNADPGDVLIVTALTLHRSGSAQVPSARRALRIDYAPRGMLDPRLEWAFDG